MTEPTSFELAATDGLRLAGYRWDPAGTARAAVQIVHGMSEHARRYADVAERLAAAGLRVYANDHRGHGASVPAGEEPGHFADEDGWSKAVEDLHLVNQHVARENPGLRRIVLAHSMGSFLTQQLSFTHPGDADAIALSATNGKPPPIAAAGRVIARAERLRLGKRGKSRLLDKLSFQDFNAKFAPNRTPFDWISRDPRAVDSYVADPLCGFMVTTQSWVDMLDALPRLTRPENLAKMRKDVPIYVFAGDHDPVALMGKGARNLVDAYRAAWLANVELKLYPDARHETLHETNREEVMADLLAWIDRVLER